MSSHAVSSSGRTLHETTFHVLQNCPDRANKKDTSKVVKSQYDEDTVTSQYLSEQQVNHQEE